MSNKKHIDRLFQEKFKDFERTPDDAVWSKIEAQLNKKKKRRVIPIWWRYAGVAALLLLLLTVGYNIFNSANPTQINTDNQIVDVEKVIDNKNKTSNSENKPETFIEETPLQENSNTNAVAKTLEEESSKTENKTESKISTPAYSKESAIANNTSTEKHNKPQKANTASKTVNNSPGLLKEAPLNTSANNALAENKKDDINTATEKDIIELSNTNKTGNTIESNAIANHIEKTPEEKIIENSLEEKSKENTETIEDAIAKNESITEEEKENLIRWSIAPNAAPVYFNTLGEGSSIASQFNSNNKTGEVNMSYGINASYAINKKLIVRSGVNRVNLGYNTNNVAVFESISSVAFNSLRSIKGDENNIAVENANVPANDNISTDVSLVSGENLKSSDIAPESFTTASSANINQSLGFIEIPLEFQYIISDKKLGLNVIGGFSSFFLNNNELFSETASSRTLIGEAVNVNKVSYSANFGLGLNYKVTKKINLNFEPMFKYQINTFNNTSGDFKPFFIGVYTGFGIKF